MSHPTYVGGFQLRAGVASSARQQRTPWALFLHPAPFQAAKRPAFCTVQRAAGSRGSLSGAAPDRGAQAAVISPQAACPSLAACGSSAMEGRPRRNISAHASKRSVDQPPARRTSGSSWRRPRPAVAPRRRSTVKAAAVPGAGDGGSMSEGEEGDLEVSRELERFDVERFRQKSAQLDLMWNVEKVPATQACANTRFIPCMYRTPCYRAGRGWEHLQFLTVISPHFCPEAFVCTVVNLYTRAISSANLEGTWSICTFLCLGGLPYSPKCGR